MKKLLSIVNILENWEVKRYMKRAVFNLNKMHVGMVIHIIALVIIFTWTIAGPAYAQLSSASGLGGDQTGGLTRPTSSGTVGPLTSPVSSYMRSTIPSPTYNPDAGNMLITGNVGGGRQFRGSVPYTAPRDFRASLPTTSIDDFLRYSTPSGLPFYSPTASPLSISPAGTVSIAKQPSDKIRQYQGNETFLYSPFQALPLQTTVSAAEALPLGKLGYQNTLLGRVQGYKTAERFITAEESAELLPASEYMVLPQQPEFAADKTKIDIDILKPFETPSETKIAPQVTKPLSKENLELDSIRKILQEQQDKEEANKLIEKIISDKWQSQLKEAEKPIGLESYRQRAAGTETSFAQAAAPVVRTAAKEEETAEQPQKIVVRDVNVYDKEFNEKMTEAKKLMEEGKFYQAVDAYTYATLYKPTEPSGYVEKALALFAAGEYRSSSQLLSAGLKLSPGYAKIKQDLSKIINDKTKLQARMTDLDKSVVAGRQPDLFYLLAYICLQTDQIAKAQQAIDLAAKAAPQDTAIADLKKIIDESRTTK